MKPIGAAAVVGIILALVILTSLDIDKPGPIAFVTVVCIGVVGILVKAGIWIYKRVTKHE